jgi:hypothetical protein
VLSSARRGGIGAGALACRAAGTWSFSLSRGGGDSVAVSLSRAEDFIPGKPEPDQSLRLVRRLERWPAVRIARRLCRTFVPGGSQLNAALKQLLTRLDFEVITAVRSCDHSSALSSSFNNGASMWNFIRVSPWVIGEKLVWNATRNRVWSEWRVSRGGWKMLSSRRNAGRWLARV